MSDVVEKTLTALPALFDSQTGAAKITNRLRQLIKSITELTSKHEEENLIKQELSAMKEQVSSPNTTMKQMREIMVRAMYCEMLGYDASFTYIHAIKLAQQGGVLEKRVGYLAVSLFLNEGHELLLLLVNTVLKDLQSTNLIEACMALTVVAQVFPKDMIPAVLPLVEDKLSHPKEIIRRKAVLALYKFYLIAPNQVQHIHAKFRKALCDKDPGVMTSSLHIYLQLIRESPDSYKDLTGSFVTILKQVVGGKLPLDFNYHSVPAPWLQIQLLRILSLLGKEDQSTSELMYEVLDESLRRAEMNHNITYAILYECVKAVYTIHPKAELLEKAARCIGNFVLSPKINLKYLGLKALTYVVQHDAKLALQHQMTIIECLDHSDFTIKRETLELLFRITNAQNVTVIIEKMLDFLRSCNDEHTIIHLVGKVAELAEKFAPDNSWFIQTMNDVFSIGGDLLQQDVPNNFLRLLAEGSESKEEDDQLRLYAVDSYLTVLKGHTSHLPQCFLQVMSWVLGEYAHLQESVDQREVIQFLTQLLDQRSVSSETRVWILSALTKISEGQTDLILDLAESLSSSQDTVLRQQAQELRHLSQDSQLHEWALPRGAPWDSIEVAGLIVFPYYDNSSTLILEGVKRVWGKDGYLPQKEATAPLVDEPSAAVQPPGQHEAAERIESRPEPSTQNQDKQQLASSLFVGLGVGSSMSLLGKSEAPPPCFRKKPRPHESPSSSSSSSGTSERSSDSSSRNTTDSFLYGSLLEEEPATAISAFDHTPKSTTANGLAQNKDTKEDRRANTSQILGGDMVIVRPSTIQDKHPPSVSSDLTALLPADLKDLPHSDVISLTSDPSLSLSSCRLFRDEALLLVIFISNCTETVIKDVSVQLTCEELKTVSLRGNVVDCLEARSTSVCHYALLMDDPHTNVSFTGTVSYQTQPGHTNTLPFSGTLSTADFIRPLVVTTEEYGKLWLSLSHDVKQNLKLLTDAGDPLRTTLNALKDALQLHVVDIIGSEGIVACRLLSGAPCLLHCRVNGTALAMWLRSPHPALPDCILYHCQRALTHH
ncbi:AP-4 complex subunit epsilon-1 [Sinocyclocheilus grahami]|uniref:AP-4 complex subunit epsilon-1 n=1 Tax=Sinocyclocheilus grahami TaxID=75366 RepID=UPI0007AD4BAC|nr:PREDICTED: AP-4 complex subunit epsilon-1-like [Sinocyclocheilus grahami]